MPTANRAFWEQKFRGNVVRDRRVRAGLRRLGWRVVVVWECETERVDRLRQRLESIMAGRLGTTGPS
jgi:DNA mismatch endonuclease (patch repair protein)